MASDSTWKKLRYFKKDSKTDNWGDVKLIQDEHLLRLDDFRHFLGTPVIVTAGVKTVGHEKNSFHYPRKDKSGKLIGACATDIIVPEYGESPFDLVMDALRFGFTGVGYYPHWRYNGEVVGGLHLDSRPLVWDADETLNYSHSRWMGVMLNEKQEYVELSFHNMLKYCNLDQDDIKLGFH